MTHRQARKQLGSRTTRRSGIAPVRLRSGARRATKKPKVAVAVRSILKKAAK